MSFPFYIARRYLFSKKSTHAINVISLISVIGVAVATMALVSAKWLQWLFRPCSIVLH